MLLSDPIIPYELPDAANHSFFYIAQSVLPKEEAKLHRHDAWELITILKGSGTFTAGDQSQFFGPGTTALLPPGLPHRWAYDDDHTGEKVRYLMVAFSQRFLNLAASSFPEFRNSFAKDALPDEAILFGPASARRITETLTKMSRESDLERLASLLPLLPFVFLTEEKSAAGRTVSVEACVRRFERAVAVIMRDYMTPMRLADIAAEIGMSPCAFSTFFRKQAGRSFSAYLADYRLKVAADLLTSTRKRVSEVALLSGFRDLPHFSKRFRARYGLSPRAYRDEKLRTTGTTEESRPA